MKRSVVTTAAIAAAVIAIYVLRIDATAGLFVDDAWYLILAKAVAEGDGFRLVSSATGAFVPAIPPLFPILLAPIWAAWPAFPDNVVALKALSIVAMFGAGAATYRYLSRTRSAPAPVAAVVAALTTALPAFVFLATSTVMADVVFAFTQLLTVIAIERAARKDAAPAAVVGSGLIAGVTLLIRTAGVAGVAAGVCFFASQRRWRAAGLFTAVVFATYLPWLAYAAMNHSSDRARMDHGGSISFTYVELLKMRYGGETASGDASLAELPRRVLDNLGNVLGRDVGAILLPSIFRGAHESGQEVFGMSGEDGVRASSMGRTTGTFLISLLFSAIAVAGFARVARDRVTVAEWLVVFTVAMVSLVPARTFRYVLPLAPFVIFYFFAGIETLAAALRRSRSLVFGAPFRIAATCLVILIVSEHGQYIWAARRGPAPLWLRDYQDVEELARWFKDADAPHGEVASNNPGLIYLWTGRKGLSMGNATGNWERWRAYGVRYAIAVLPTEKPAPWLGYQVIHESAPGRGLWVLDTQPGDNK